jgi:hypothetical protein
MTETKALYGKQGVCGRCAYYDGPQPYEMADVRAVARCRERYITTYWACNCCEQFERKDEDEEMTTDQFDCEVPAEERPATRGDGRYPYEYAPTREEVEAAHKKAITAMVDLQRILQAWLMHGGTPLLYAVDDTLRNLLQMMSDGEPGSREVE